jgi:serine/threonine protein kinase
MSVGAPTEFQDSLKKSGLVEPAALAGACPHGLPDDAHDAAQILVDKGLLTRFQAKMLLQGKHRGLLFGPYRLLDQIGRGGMGIVYLAEHSKLQRQVAIKVLPKEKTSDKLALDRFYREARAAASLDHPNIVKAYDVGEHMGIHYFAMEYVLGVNLQTQLTQKGPLPWRTAARFVAQACEGLQHAHERRLVHRDIKPANLLVDKQGTLKILDFGLARCFLKAIDNLTAIHSTGDDIIGSVDYMAPELAMGKQQCDIRADLYSLGVTLFALIVGKPPFRGSAAQTLLQHQMKPLPALHEFQPDVPETLSVVMARMTQKEPQKRYPSPASVLDALAPWLASTGNTGRFEAVAPAPRDTARVSARHTDQAQRPSSRDTKVMLDDDTLTDVDVNEQDSSPTRSRKRRKKRRRSQRSYAWLWGVVPALILVPLTIWGAVALVKYASQSRPQFAAADTRGSPTPGATAPAPSPPPAQPPAQPPPYEPPPSAPSLPGGAGLPQGPGDGLLTPPPGGGGVLPQAPGGAEIPPMPPGGGGLPPAPGGGAPPPAPGGARDEGGVAVGQPAPEIDGEDLANECFLLSDYRGKVVLLDFWGFW